MPVLHAFYRIAPAKTQNVPADVSRAETSQARTLGTDPKSGKPVIARFGRFGPMLQLGEVEGEEEKPKFAPLPVGKTLDTVTFADAM